MAVAQAEGPSATVFHEWRSGREQESAKSLVQLHYGKETRLSRGVFVFVGVRLVVWSFVDAPLTPQWLPEIITVGMSGKGRQSSQGMPSIGHGRRNPNQARRKR
jgi:hypothetical protein